MMKKLYLLIILASMTFLLVSCADKQVEEPEPEPPSCVGDDCDAPPAPPLPCDQDPNRDEREECKEDVVEEEEEEKSDPPADPPPQDPPDDPPPPPDPPKGDGLAFVNRTEAQPVEEAPKSPPTEPAFVKRTEAQVIEQEKEEELIVEEKDADESVQPPKAEEIMILPPEEADTAFSEMGMIYFAYDKSEISAEFEEVIQKNYEWIFQNPDAQVQLEGHCDERGTNEYNLALGERRAKAVFDYLVSLGANPSQFTIVSFGEERPVAFGSAESSWRQNRRVEFTRL